MLWSYYDQTISAIFMQGTIAKSNIFFRSTLETANATIFIKFTFYIIKLMYFLVIIATIIQIIADLQSL
ncbi:hypothetical protein CAP51_08740 [Acinetobacter populi]|uniref:Uncharacterized protein n=1 Tax=Acinetobacter populi TaxID=1582270 RepID=A0A1Z9Z020_9GAMM|nr:hypothetical protein CAP51_08740 [Acinetobacter populi]